MTDQIVKSLTDPSFLIALLVSIAVFATVFTVMPALGGNPLKARMKSVALERDELRAKQRARLAAESDRRRKGLREEQSVGMKNIVERLDLRRALVDIAYRARLHLDQTAGSYAPPLGVVHPQRGRRPRDGDAVGFPDLGDVAGVVES